MVRPIHIPLSGRDRRYFVRQLKNAPQFEASNLRRPAVLRANGEAKLKEARRLECEAWNARLFYGGSAQPLPTIADAIDGGFGRLEAGCHQCNRINTVDLALLRPRPFAGFAFVLTARYFRLCDPAGTPSSSRYHILVGPEAGRLRRQFSRPDNRRPVRQGLGYARSVSRSRRVAAGFSSE
jgi:hypothetical protein